MLGTLSPAASRPARAARRLQVSPACLAQRGVICRSCREHCDPLAIRFEILPGGRSLPLIDPARCDGCGECVRVCPVGAVALRAAQAEAA